MTALTEKKLDPIDHRILEILQKNARTRLNEMAQQLGLTIPTISERIQKLEDRGFIKGYTAILDAKRLGKDITAFITVSIDSSKHYQMFMERARETEEILECHSVTGEGQAPRHQISSNGLRLIRSHREAWRRGPCQTRPPRRLRRWPRAPS